MFDKDRPYFDDYIGSFAKTFGRGDVVDDTRVYWSALQQFTLPEFQAAMREMAETAKFMPKPSEIADLCHAIRLADLDKQRSDGEDEPHWRQSSYRCQLCKDTGWVMVWHPNSQFDARRIVLGEVPESFKPRRHACSLHCSCKKGERIRTAHEQGREKKGRRNRFREIARYNPDQPWVICQSGGDQSDVARLIEWAENFTPEPRPLAFDD